MSYIDWEFYNSHFPKLDQEAFERILPQAEMKINIYTHFRCRDAAGYKLEQVRAAAANLVNAIADQERTGAGKGISSASNDGYSESYVNSTKGQAEEELKDICYNWLSGTGLMRCM